MSPRVSRKAGKGWSSIIFQGPSFISLKLGVWSIQVERGGTIALLRSLQWPGYLFFHRPTHGTAPNAQWGAVYQGTGQRNDNIGFMLS